MANIHQTIAEIDKVNPELAAQVRRFVRDHSYGLVYEQNLPDSVRLWTKKPAKYDKVHLLPPRGQFDTEENFKDWYVSDIVEGTATLTDGKEVRIVSVDDIVPVVNHKDVIYPGLKVIDKIERGEKTDPYHMVINAENYHALEALVYAYAGKVDCIYIDPPYNKEDSKDWKYNCNYVDGNDQYKHSKWLTMMERRLKLAKKLLNPSDSVLIVTVDEQEYLRLGLLLEQLFPDAQIQKITDVINPRGTNRENEFSRVDEYIYVCRFGSSSIAKTEDNMLGNTDEVGKARVWYAFNRGNNLRETANGQFFPIYIDVSTKKIVSVGDSLELSNTIEDFPKIEGLVSVFPINDRGDESIWRAIPETTRDWIDKGYVKVSKFDKRNNRWTLSYIPSGIQSRIESGEIVVSGKKEDGSLDLMHISTDNETVNPRNVWVRQYHNSTDYGASINKKLIPGHAFSYPKSLYSVEDVLRFFVADKPNALIVDFFAGSGTTTHATMLLNSQDGGHRRSILVTNNEIGPDNEVDFTVNKNLRPFDAGWQAFGIAKYITWERIKAAITGINASGEPIDGEYFSYSFSDVEKNRNYVQLDFIDNPQKLSVSQKKKILKLLSAGKMPQKLILSGSKFVVSSDEKHKISILFDVSALDDWLVELSGKEHITDIYVVTDNDKLFKEIKSSVEDILGKFVVSEPFLIPMSEGFKENAVFCELTYENVWDIRLDRAFNAVAPILWALAGCKGPIIEKLGKGYATTCNYAVLFKYDAVSKFVEAIKKKPNIEHVFVVTDDQTRFTNVVRRLYMIKPENIHRLYEGYLKSFEIVGEGGLD